MSFSSHGVVGHVITSPHTELITAGGGKDKNTAQLG